MKFLPSLFRLTLLSILVFLASSCTKTTPKHYFRQELKNNWTVFNADSIKTSGEQVSAQNFKATKEYPTSVPSTVLHVLVENGVYKNIYKDMNLKKIPVEQFQKPWWYRTEFNLKKYPRHCCYALTASIIKPMSGLTENRLPAIPI
jgi:exo-1,4-beta-D-glucosaminidase